MSSRLTEGKEKKYLCFGLMPNFGSAENMIDLEEFLIRRFGWDEINAYFPDIDLKQFVELEHDKHPHFIVLGDLLKAPAKKPSEEMIERREGKTHITLLPLIFYSFDLINLYFKKQLLLLNLLKESRTPIIVSTGFFRYISEKGSCITKHRSLNIDMNRLLAADSNGDLFFPKDHYLSNEEVQKLKIFKKNVYAYLLKDNPDRKEKYIQIAMNFFWEGCIKEIDEDKEEMAILDFIIGLEALFLEHEQELRYKFANRMALLLGNSEAERKAFQGYADEIYGLRNKIVHGKLLKEDIRKRLSSRPGISLSHRTIGDKRYWIKEVLRTSIVYFLSLHMNGLEKQELVLNLLDSALFNASDRERLLMMKRRLLPKEK